MNKRFGPVRYHTGAFPPTAEQLNWPRLIPLVGPAAAAVARYDGLLTAIPNPDILLAPLTTQEAVLSSRIEGTQATMAEVLEFEAGREVETKDRRDDIQEVLNYRAALREAERLLSDVPLSTRVVKAVHRVLMDGVRGQHKAPGEFRRIPNWIGPRDCTIEEATFVPMSAESLEAGMDRWQRYAHEEAPDRLVQLALLHVEFEALHPFLDGNGRLGRMLVPLYLWQVRLIHRPMFYVSGYFEARRDEYYDRLLAVSRDGDWTGWCRFFLEAIRAQAEENLEKARQILDLYEEMKLRIPELTRSQYAIRAVDWIFSRPVFQSTAFIREGEVPAATARRILGVLKSEDVLSVIRPAAGRRPAILAFPGLINIAEGREVLG